MRFLYFFCLAIFCYAAHGQQNNPELRASENFDSIGPERIFVHYNSKVALVGEYLYFKVYCLNGVDLRLSQVSKVAYIELIKDDGERVFKKKVRLENGLGQGDFFIPVTTSSGNYKLVCYTQWMRNWGQDIFFQEDITIINPYNNNQGSFYDTTENHDTVDIQPMNMAVNNTEGPLLLEISKKGLGKRQAVNVVIKKGLKGEVKGNYSLSVKKYDTVFPEFGYSTTGFAKETKLALPDKKNAYLPEIRGQLITGNIVSNSSISPKNTHVALSIPGPRYQIKVTQPQENGYFQFNVDNEHQYETAFIQILDKKDDEPYTITMDTSSTVVDYKKISFKSFRLEPKMNSYILERSIQNQIENAYFKVKPDTVTTRMGKYNFYGDNGKSYILDDYTRFSTVSETALEVLQDVWIYKDKKGKQRFGIRSENDVFGDTDYNTLVIVDGLVVQEHDGFISDYSSNLIKSITVIPEYYRMGSQIFDGVIDIQTIDLDYLTKFKKDNLTVMDFAKPTEIKNYFSQTYVENPSNNLDRIPDQRRQLLWLPNIEIENENEERIISFYTSDVQGDFEISLEGFTVTGEPVSLKEIITVN